MDEEELIELAKKGDEAAFEKLMKHHYPKVLRHCREMVKDEGIAEDLTQEVFLRAFQKLSHFQARARFSTWIWRIAHNLCLNHLRKKKPIEQELEEGKIGEKETVFEGEEISERLMKLPERQREVFVLLLQGYTQKQIAERLGIPYGTVRSRVFNARKTLGSLFEEL